MSCSATYDVLSIRSLTDMQFRLLIWLAECDNGETMTISARYLSQRTGISAGDAIDTLRAFCVEKLPAAAWSIDPTSSADDIGDLTISITSGMLYSLREFA
jgi:hypothetical protein